MEKFNLGNSLEKKIDNLSKFLRGRVAIGAFAVSTLFLNACHEANDYTKYGSFDEAFKKAKNDKQSEFVWNDKKYEVKTADYKIDKRKDLNDYTEFGRFNYAFAKAREEGEKEFVWNGERYKVDLVDQELSDLVFESKEFLEKYYNSDYFKNKLLSEYDSSDAERSVNKKINSKIEQSNQLIEKYGYESKKGMDLLDKTEKLYSLIYNEAKIKKMADYTEFLDSVKESKSDKYINNLNKPMYFSITEEKSKNQTEDGYYTGKDEKSIFISKNKKSPNDITTAVHEFSHKSSDGTKGMELGFFRKMNKSIDTYIYNNKEQQKFLLEKYNKKFIEDYLLNYTEIDARQNSTRFWLYKNKEGYDVTKPFTETDYDFVLKNKDKLPYDIVQLLDLFPSKEVFVKNMNEF